MPDPLDLATLDPAGAAKRAPDASFVTLTVLAHPDASRVGQRAQLPLLETARARAAVSRAEPAFRAPGLRGTPLTCPFVSRRPLWLDALGGGGVRFDPSESGSRIELDGRVLDAPLDVAAERLDAGVVLQLGGHVVLLVHREPALEAADDSLGIIGDSAPIRALRASVRKLAGDAAPVLVSGESGSGKELVAAALHAAGPRRGGPFVAVNMAAIPATLAASELFGHAKGAFSGAEQAHDGFFVRAHGGTLFLDEIGDTPAEVQAMLLRVLESGEVQAVGARSVRKVDVRLVTATDADLDLAIGDGRFRLPLYYRLATSRLHVPALRERKADVGRLVLHFLGAELATLGRSALLSVAETEERPWLAAGLIARLARYAWPGNVRQLRAVCHALALDSASAEPLAVSGPELDRLLPEARVAAVAAEQRAASDDEAPARRAGGPAVDPDEIERVMIAVEYRLGAAADWLGISRPWMNDLVDRHPRLRRAQRMDADEIRRGLEAARASGEPAWRVLGVSDHALKRRMKELGIV